MLLIAQIFLLLPVSAFCGFPSKFPSETSKEFNDLSKWALTQVFIYYTEEFDQLAIPDCHGTLLSNQHVLTKGSCVKNQEKLLIVKVQQSVEIQNKKYFFQFLRAYYLFFAPTTIQKLNI